MFIRNFSEITKIIFISFMCLIFKLPAQEENAQNNGFKVNFNHEHELHLSEDAESFNCYPLAGKKLVECFIGLNPQEQRKTFSRIAFKRRREILRKLSYEQFYFFTSECTDAEWSEMHARLTPLEQKNIPTELSEVKNELQRIHLLALATDAGTKVYAIVGQIDPAWAMLYFLMDLGYHVADKNCTVYTSSTNQALDNYFKKTFLKDE